LIVIVIGLLSVFMLSCTGSSGGGNDDGDDDGDQSLTITGESGDPVNLNGTWNSGCIAYIGDGESEKWVLTVSGSAFSQEENFWFDSTTCSGASDVTFSISGTLTLSSELTATMNGSNVTATRADVAFSSNEGTINNPDLVADFNANEECGFDDWVVDTPKDLIGTDCSLDSPFKDVLYIDDMGDPDVSYSGDGEGALDVNGYPTVIDLESEAERL
jgi:hypothetical protein